MIAAILAAVSVAAATPQPADTLMLDPHAGSWLHGPNLPAPRQAPAVVTLGGRIYVIGGLGPGAQPVNTTFVLEPAPGTNLAPTMEQPPAPTLPVGTWSSSRAIPEPVDHAAAAELDGYIYVVGGVVEKLVTNKAWRYDPIGDSWAALPPLPVPRYAPTMQAFGGKLYVIGGTAAHGNDERSVEVYDPATNAWSLIDNALGVEREGASTAVFNGRIALVGGRDRDEHNQPFCDLWNPLVDAWSTCSHLHMARSDFGLAAVGDRLFAIGGVNVLTGMTTQTIEISGHDGEGWMDGRWMPSPRKDMGIAVIGHTVWVIGGSNWDTESPTASVLRYVIPVIRVKFGGRAPE